MEKLNFDLGIRTYAVNDDEGATISFNPADPVFLGELLAAFEALEREQEALRAEMLKTTEGQFDLNRRKDAEAREIIDKCFGHPVCEAAFPAFISVFAIADGLPVWCNFLLSVMEEMHDVIGGENEKAKYRIEKYTAKYAKKRKKK